MITQEKINCLKIMTQALSAKDIREGMAAIISVKIGEPQFEGQTKQKLGNSEARGAVDSVVSEKVMIFLEQNPTVAKLIVDKALMAQSGDLKKSKRFDKKKISA